MIDVLKGGNVPKRRKVDIWLNTRLKRGKYDRCTKRWKMGLNGGQWIFDWNETKTWKMFNSVESDRHTKRWKASLNGGKWNIWLNSMIRLKRGKYDRHTKRRKTSLNGGKWNIWLKTAMRLKRGRWIQFKDNTKRWKVENSRGMDGETKPRKFLHFATKSYENAGTRQ